MTPAARLQAAIELLDEIIASARNEGSAADTLISQYFRKRRYAGSKDRAAVRAYVFDVLRSDAIEGDDVSGRSAVMQCAKAHHPEWLSCFGAGGHGPDSLTDAEISSMPGVVPTISDVRFSAYGPQLVRAPLDIRVDTRHVSRADVMSQLVRVGIECVPTPFALHGLRCATDSAIEATELFQSGLIHVQDEGSQLIAQLALAQPGDVVIDLCAGAGGKTLALAAAMDGRGRLIAHDIDSARLARLAPRAKKSGFDDWIEYHTDQLSDFKAQADVVLVDAPCTGSGTWRRNPEARLRPHADRLKRLVSIQKQLIEQAADLVKPKGRILYAVCSILSEEGEAHLADLPVGLHVVDWQTLWPQTHTKPVSVSKAENCLKLTSFAHGCDGFFIVCLQKA
jgi:16S rRNA (cytosine967-C5)-methyltransferase